MSDPYLIGEIYEETELALCLLTENHKGKTCQLWLPKSKIKVTSIGRCLVSVQVPYWLIRENASILKG